MTKKDFELIARTIATLPRELRGRVAHAFSQSLSNSNPRFDGDRFLAACGAGVRND